MEIDGFRIEVPAEYPECYVSRAFRGMPESDGDEERLDECSIFTADRIEHSFAKRICGSDDTALAEIASHAEDMGIECVYGPYGGPDGRGAILLSIR